MKQVETILNRLIYLKYCWSRSQSNLNIVMAIANYGMLSAILAKEYGFDKGSIGILLVAAVCLSLLLGHLDIKYHIVDREMSLTNQHNPEIAQLIGKIK